MEFQRTGVGIIGQSVLGRRWRQLGRVRIEYDTIAYDTSEVDNEGEGRDYAGSGEWDQPDSSEDGGDEGTELESSEDEGSSSEDSGDEGTELESSEDKGSSSEDGGDEGTELESSEDEGSLDLDGDAESDEFESEDEVCENLGGGDKRGGFGGSEDERNREVEDKINADICTAGKGLVNIRDLWRRRAAARAAKQGPTANAEDGVEWGSTGAEPSDVERGGVQATGQAVGRAPAEPTNKSLPRLFTIHLVFRARYETKTETVCDARHWVTVTSATSFSEISAMVRRYLQLPIRPHRRPVIFARVLGYGKAGGEFWKDGINQNVWKDGINQNVAFRNLEKPMRRIEGGEEGWRDILVHAWKGLERRRRSPRLWSSEEADNKEQVVIEVSGHSG